jgi:hypothetical protein
VALRRRFIDRESAMSVNSLRGRPVPLALAVSLLSLAPVAAPADDAPALPPGAASAEASRWWTAGFQSTYVIQRKPAMRSPYQGENSLLAEAETGYTLTATVFLGARPWSGGELFINPEAIQSVELSRLSGLGGFSNGENQKSGGPIPTPYLARLFLRQTIDLGGAPVAIEAGPNQLAGQATRRRLVVTAGKLGLIDVFDDNAWSHDPRTQFFNWALMTYGASDYAADARGYTWGLAVEWYHDDWALRLGRFAQPKESNGLALNPDILHSFGDSLELEHTHEVGGLFGKVRVAAWRNVASMGAFRDALAAAGGGTPSVADVRRSQAKQGFGAAFEQALPAGLGVFGRYSWNDGRTETYAFTEIERSLALGLGARGTGWGRPEDVAGLAFVQNGLGAAHADYLAAGGLGVFIGDGRLTYAPERILEAYYAWQVTGGFWVTGDYQRIENPAYNADRGPATFLGGRLHLEF